MISIDETAILSTATGYTPDKVLTFLNSIEKIKYQGTVVLFINEDQFEIYQQYFKKYTYHFSINFIKTPIGVFYSSKKINKFLKRFIQIFSNCIVKKENKLYKEFLRHLGMPHVSRFFEYYDYLVLNKFKYVVLTDSRDVIFQKNLFDYPINGLFLGMEDANTCIGNDSFHIKWISDVYGKNYLKNISNKQISCAGVTFGDYDSIMSYLDTMIKEFTSLPYYTMVRSNYDQGIHNKLLYSEDFKNVNICQPLFSNILTLGVLDKNKITMNKLGHLLNKDGSTPAIVHQYDRHKSLEHEIYRIYNS